MHIRFLHSPPSMMSDSLAQILKSLSEQLEGLISSIDISQSQVDTHQAEAQLPCITWEGPLFNAIRQSDPKWFVIYVSQLRSRATTDNTHNVHLLIVSTLLCLQRRFKELLLSGNSILSLLCDFIKSFSDLSDVDVKLWFKECVYAFFKSQADKPRLVTPQMESAGLTFQDQENLIKSIQANPQMASEAFGTTKLPSDEWSTDASESESLMSHLVSDLVIRNLVSAKAAPALACIARVPVHRKLLVRYGAVQTLIDSDTGDKEQNRVALARICMTTNPSVWNPSQLTDLTNMCFNLFVSTKYELYQFEAAIGLTNLLSYSPDLREYLMTKPNIVDLLFDTLGSCSNAQLRAATAEVFCNLSLSESLQIAAAEGKFKEPIRILFFLTTNSDDERLRNATSGALAILTENPVVCRAIEKVVDKDTLKSLLDSMDQNSPDLVLRTLCVITNIIANTVDGTIRSELNKILASRGECLKKIPDERVTRMLAQLGSYPLSSTVSTIRRKKSLDVHRVEPRGVELFNINQCLP